MLLTQEKLSELGDLSNKDMINSKPLNNNALNLELSHNSVFNQNNINFLYKIWNKNPESRKTFFLPEKLPSEVKVKRNTFINPFVNSDFSYINCVKKENRKKMSYSIGQNETCKIEQVCEKPPKRERLTKAKSEFLQRIDPNKIQDMLIPKKSIDKSKDKQFVIKKVTTIDLTKELMLQMDNGNKSNPNVIDRFRKERPIYGRFGCVSPKNGF